MKQPFLYILLREIPDQADIRKLYGEDDHRLDAIAQVLALDSRWNRIENPTFIIRRNPSPVVGVMGYFDAEQRLVVEGLHRLMSPILRDLRYIDYQQAERDCEQLAARLIKTIGRQELTRYHFAGIPRGGLIVLGMLSYILDLSPSQLTLEADAPLVVVDDCAISGARFGQYIKSFKDQRLVFAPLYANEALLKTIAAREPTVAACVSAHNLRDHAPDYLQDQYEIWHAQWQERVGGQTYWIGMPEHICFAWNEPDNSIWNPVTGAQELGWRLVPDQFCLKNRSANRLPAASIQTQLTANGELKPTSGILFGSLEQDVIVANIDTGVNVCLSGAAGDMWRAIIEAPDIDTAKQHLLQVYAIDEATLSADLHEFVSSMRKQGFLTE